MYTCIENLLSNSPSQKTTQRVFAQPEDIVERVLEYLLQVEDDGSMSDACNPKPLGNNQNEESDEDGGDKAPEIIPDESQPTIVVSVRQAGPRQAKNNATCIMHDLLQAGSNPKKDKGKSKVHMHSIALLINTQVIDDHDIGSLDVGPPRPSSSRAHGQLITDDMVCV